MDRRKSHLDWKKLDLVQGRKMTVIIRNIPRSGSIFRSFTPSLKSFNCGSKLNINGRWTCLETENIKMKRSFGSLASSNSFRSSSLKNPIVYPFTSSTHNSLITDSYLLKQALLTSQFNLVQIRSLSKLKQKKLKYPKYFLRLRDRKPQRNPFKKLKMKNRKAAVSRWIVLSNDRFARRQAGRGHGNFSMRTRTRLAKRRRVLAHGWHIERLKRLMPYFRKRYMRS